MSSENENMESYLKRIATALEKIADHLQDIRKMRDAFHSSFPKPSPKKVNYPENTAGDMPQTNTNTEETNMYPGGIIEFLKQKNITIKNIKTEVEADKILDDIALYMGNNYSKIKKVYELIKRHMNTGAYFNIILKNFTQDEISSITYFGHQLHQIAFLEEYKYLRSPEYKLMGKVNRIPGVLNFFSGGWLERYVKKTIIDILENIPVRYSCLTNPQIILPNGNDFELDILFRIENEIFWFEAKTGDYQRYVQKYAKVAKILGLNKNNAYMILTDIAENTAQALKTLFGMNVVDVNNFKSEFRERISMLLDEKGLKNDNHQE